MSTPKRDQKVAIAFPHPDDVSAKFMRSMLYLWRLDAIGGKRLDGSKVGGRQRIINGGALIAVSSGAVIARTRNKIVREFLTHDADWLLTIDTDMTFEPTLVEDLIDAAHPTERPIVGALCFAYMADNARKLWPTLYAWIPGSERLRRLTQYPADTLIPVAATGAACLLVHRSVFVEMAKRWPPPRPWFDETPFYEKGEDGEPDLSTGDEYSEDLTFSLRAQAAGFPVHVHTGIRCGHVKEFIADEDAFIAESEALREACMPALPTYAVIASKDRPEMLARLRAQLEDQTSAVFVFDNGSAEPIPDAIKAEGWSLTRMWNVGLDLAKQTAAGAPYNVIVINDDVEVPNEFAAQLEAGLRSHDDHWLAYPNHRDLDIPPGEAVRTQSDELAGQTLSGWAFMVRGEAGLHFDEQFTWWYADSDLERQVRERGKFTVCVGGCEVRHLDPLRSTMEDADRLAMAQLDEKRYAAKWDLDPETLWLARRTS
jgi:GT2 family glycosyltransferase